MISLFSFRGLQLGLGKNQNTLRETDIRSVMKQMIAKINFIKMTH